MARDMSTIEESLRPQITEQPAPQPDSSLLPVGTPISDVVEGQTKKRKPRTKKATPPSVPEERIEENQLPPPPSPDQRQEQQPVAQSSMLQFFQSARGILKDVGVRLENVPTPGSITLPLILLLVFFFLIVPVNGSTRFTWLWLVLSGDAGTSGSQGNISGPANNSSGSNVPGSSGAAGGGTSGANAFPIPSTTSTMTGVEDL